MGGLVPPSASDDWRLAKNGHPLIHRTCRDESVGPNRRQRQGFSATASAEEPKTSKGTIKVTRRYPY
jgi:hypothetical protein